MKNIVNLLVVLLLISFVSCEKNKLEASDFLLSSLLGSNEQFGDFFYVSKQAVAYPWTSNQFLRTWKISGKSKNQSVNEFSVNGIKIPKYA